jgi:hypothetical protein
MHPLSQLLFDFPKLRSHAVAPGDPLQNELPATRLSANKGKAQESEGFRFATPALGTLSRREAAELDQAGLFRM